MPKPVASYPAAIAGDQQLAIAVNRFTTSLALSMGSADTQMTVVNPANIVSDMLLSLDTDGEIVQVLAPPSGNVVSISRAFDGTNAVVHLAGATVSGLVDAYHHNTLVAEVEAIEQALGPNLNRIPGSVMTASSAYNFAPQTPGGSLTVGTNQITLSPVPQGVNGTDQSHYLWISGGTGAPEAVLITGGTAVAGAPSGTLFFSCVNAHTGAWTISTATSGIQEAIQSLDTAGHGGTVYVPQGNWPTHAPIMIDAQFISLNGAGRGSAVITADLNVCPVIQIGTGNRTVPTYNGIAHLTVTRAAGTIPTNCFGVYWYFFNMGWAENVEYSRHYVGEKITHPATGGVCIGFFSDLCTMWGSSYANVWCEHVAGVKYSRLYMGSATETQSGQVAPTNGVVISADANDIKFDRCDWLCPGTSSPSQMQWGVLFTAMPSATGMFIFSDCNWENLGQGVFTSDSTCTGLNWVEVDGGRDGNAGTAFFTQFNAATAITQISLMGATMNSQIQLTSPRWSRITNCLIGGKMTISGGDILIGNNLFLTDPYFTGTFLCLNLGPNSYVNNGSADIEPNLSAASGRLYVQTQHDTSAFHALPARPEGATPAFSGTTLTLSDSFCTLSTGGTVATIAAPYPGFSGVAYIAVAGNPVTFQTGGNIAGALSAAAGTLVTAAFSKSQNLWFLSS